MTSAPLPSGEYARLLELSRYKILDTPAEAAFDRIINGSDSFQQVRCQQNSIFQPLPELNSIRHRHSD